MFTFFFRVIDKEKLNVNQLARLPTPRGRQTWRTSLSFARSATLRSILGSRDLPQVGLDRCRLFAANFASSRGRFPNLTRARVNDITSRRTREIAHLLARAESLETPSGYVYDASRDAGHAGGAGGERGI